MQNQGQLQDFFSLAGLKRGLILLNFIKCCRGSTRATEISDRALAAPSLVVAPSSCKMHTIAEQWIEKSPLKIELDERLTWWRAGSARGRRRRSGGSGWPQRPHAPCRHQRRTRGGPRPSTTRRWAVLDAIHSRGTVSAVSTSAGGCRGSMKSKLNWHLMCGTHNIKLKHTPYLGVCSPLGRDSPFDRSEDQQMYYTRKTQTGKMTFDTYLQLQCYKKNGRWCYFFSTCKEDCRCANSTKKGWSLDSNFLTSELSTCKRK